jgi:hypothetical protein
MAFAEGSQRVDGVGNLIGRFEVDGEVTVKACRAAQREHVARVARNPDGDVRPNRSWKEGDVVDGVVLAAVAERHGEIIAAADGPITPATSILEVLRRRRHVRVELTTVGVGDSM